MNVVTYTEFGKGANKVNKGRQYIMRGAYCTGRVGLHGTMKNDRKEIGWLYSVGIGEIARKG